VGGLGRVRLFFLFSGFIGLLTKTQASWPTRRPAQRP